MLKAKNPDVWEQQRAELFSDGETGQALLGFLERWAELTEGALDGATSVADALGDQLVPVEAELGRIGTGFIGQILVLLCAHWRFGDDLANSLTTIELRLVQDTLALKLASLQDGADSQ